MFDHASAEEQDSAVFAQITFAAAKAGGDGGSGVNIEVFDGYSDLPAFLSNGSIYIQAPLGYVLETVAADISDGKRYLEVRVSKARRAAFPFTRVWRAISGQRLA